MVTEVSPKKIVKETSRKKNVGQRKPKRKRLSPLGYSVVLIFLGICVYLLYSYLNPSLYGSWISESTQEKVTFKENGTIEL